MVPAKDVRALFWFGDHKVMTAQVWRFEKPVHLEVWEDVFFNFPSFQRVEKFRFRNRNHYFS